MSLAPLSGPLSASGHQKPVFGRKTSLPCPARHLQDVSPHTSSSYLRSFSLTVLSLFLGGVNYATAQQVAPQDPARVSTENPSPALATPSVQTPQTSAATAVTPATAAENRDKAFALNAQLLNRFHQAFIRFKQMEDFTSRTRSVTVDHKQTTDDLAAISQQLQGTVTGREDELFKIYETLQTTYPDIQQRFQGLVQSALIRKAAMGTSKISQENIDKDVDAFMNPKFPIERDKDAMERMTPADHARLERSRRRTQMLNYLQAGLFYDSFRIERAASLGKRDPDAIGSPEVFTQIQQIIPTPSRRPQMTAELRGMLEAFINDIEEDYETLRENMRYERNAGFKVLQLVHDRLAGNAIYTQNTLGARMIKLEMQNRRDTAAIRKDMLEADLPRLRAELVQLDKLIKEADAKLLQSKVVRADALAEVYAREILPALKNSTAYSPAVLAEVQSFIEQMEKLAQEHPRVQVVVDTPNDIKTKLSEYAAAVLILEQADLRNKIAADKNENDTVLGLLFQNLLNTTAFREIPRVASLIVLEDGEKRASFERELAVENYTIAFKQLERKEREYQILLLDEQIAARRNERSTRDAGNKVVVDALAEKARAGLKDYLASIFTLVDAQNPDQGAMRKFVKKYESVMPAATRDAFLKNLEQLEKLKPGVPESMRDVDYPGIVDKYYNALVPLFKETKVTIDGVETTLEKLVIVEEQGLFLGISRALNGYNVVITDYKTKKEGADGSTITDADALSKLEATVSELRAADRAAIEKEEADIEAAKKAKAQAVTAAAKTVKTGAAEIIREP